MGRDENFTGASPVYFILPFLLLYHLPIFSWLLIHFRHFQGKLVLLPVLVGVREFYNVRTQ